MICGVDLSDEKVNAKIAKAHSERVPFMLVVGPKEVQSNTVNVRIRQCKETKTVDFNEFFRMAAKKIAEKDLDLMF